MARRGEKLLRGVIQRCEISLFQKTPDIATEHMTDRKVRRPFGIGSTEALLYLLIFVYVHYISSGHLEHSAAILPNEYRWQRR